jgi:hypothetical protein
MELIPKVCLNGDPFGTFSVILKSSVSRNTIAFLHFRFCHNLDKWPLYSSSFSLIGVREEWIH